MGKKVIVYADQLDADGIGDFVKCLNCGALLLVVIGEDTCPKCKDEMLTWADKKHQECSVEELEQMGYEVEVR